MEAIHICIIKMFCEKNMLFYVYFVYVLECCNDRSHVLLAEDIVVIAFYSILVRLYIIKKIGVYVLKRISK